MGSRRAGRQKWGSIVLVNRTDGFLGSRSFNSIFQMQRPLAHFLTFSEEKSTVGYSCPKLEAPTCQSHTGSSRASLQACRKAGRPGKSLAKSLQSPGKAGPQNLDTLLQRDNCSHQESGGSLSAGSEAPNDQQARWAVDKGGSRCPTVLLSGAVPRSAAVEAGSESLPLWPAPRGKTY